MVVARDSSFGLKVFCSRQNVNGVKSSGVVLAEPRSRCTRRDIACGFLFFDWFAIPQITARVEGVNEEATRSDAALAVRSIPAYVEASNLFIALVPELVHMETGLPCNYASYLSRGWCRAELWCHLLSNKSNTSVIVIYSSGSVQTPTYEFFCGQGPDVYRALQCKRPFCVWTVLGSMTRLCQKLSCC